MGWNEMRQQCSLRLSKTLLRIGLFIFCVHTAVSSATDFDALAYYKYLHANPELSFQESNTATMRADTLEQAGYEVTRSVGGHGVVALLRNGEGPTVLMRADMDALPVAEQTDLPYASTQRAIELDGREVSVMHACGHDVHMTVVIDAALTMLNRREDWQGTLMVIMQPAEMKRYILKRAVRQLAPSLPTLRWDIEGWFGGSTEFCLILSYLQHRSAHYRFPTWT